MTTRKYKSRSQKTTLSSPLAAGATSMTVNSGSTLAVSAVPNGQTYTVVIDPDTSLEEIVDITNWTSGNTFTIARGIDGSSDVAHSAGAVVRHMAIGRDYTEANTHIEASTAVHGLTAGVAVVGDTATQTLTNKTINAANNTITGITSAMITDGTIVNGDINASAAIAYSKLALTGAITSSDIANDTIVNADINTAAAIAPTKIAGTAVTLADVGTVTGTMIASNTIVDADINSSAAIARTKIANPTADVSNGGFKLTNLGTPTVSTDASTKAYVDSQITALVGGAPGTLDTLGEIATAINSSGSFATSVVLRDGTQAMTGALAMGTNKITGLGTPTTSTDAATKAYADSIVATAPSNLTGPITSVGAATAVAAQTGTGSTFVMQASPTLTTPNLGTPSAATLTNATGLPISGLVASTSTAIGVGSINLGHASDTALTRNAAGVLAVNGYVIPDVSSVNILSQKSLSSTKEVVSIYATAATGTINFDTTGANVMYYTSNATGNWTLNVRGGVATTLNTNLSIGQTATIVFLVTNGTTAYYPTALTIDGSAQTVKWQGGAAPTSGNASSIDAYTYTIIKTAVSTYTVLGSQSKFA